MKTTLVESGPKFERLRVGVWLPRCICVLFCAVGVSCTVVVLVTYNNCDDKPIFRFYLC